VGASGGACRWPRAWRYAEGDEEALVARVGVEEEDGVAEPDGVGDDEPEPEIGLPEDDGRQAVGEPVVGRRWAKAGRAWTSQ
jgi:hypothetical protein